MRFLTSFLSLIVAFLALSLFLSSPQSVESRSHSHPHSHSHVKVNVEVNVDGEEESERKVDHRRHHYNSSSAHSFSSLSSDSSSSSSSAKSHLLSLVQTTFSPVPNPSAFSFQCHLLGAAITAYDVEGSGQYHPTQPQSSLAQFDSNPRVLIFTAGPLQVDSCLIGYSSAIGGLVIAFRGTESMDFQDFFGSTYDWIQDLDFEPIVPTTVNYFPPGGAVHKGFWQSVDALWNQLESAMSELYRPGMKLFLTGHSKGAAQAVIAAYRLYHEKNIKATGVWGFATPHLGNTAWVKSFPLKEVPIHRFEVGEDLVPKVPPNLKEADNYMSKIPIIGQLFKSMKHSDYVKYGDYVPIGSDLTWITNDAKTHPADPSPQQTKKVFQDNLMLGVVGVGNLLRYHDGHCATGIFKGLYMKAICPGACVKK